MKLFVLVSKVLPIVLALCHLLNCIFGYFGWNNIILGYISGISILTISYLYLVSYLIKLCGYYRMFLHYTTVTWILNIIDLYIGIPISNFCYLGILLIIAGVSLFIILLLYYKTNKKICLK